MNKKCNSLRNKYLLLALILILFTAILFCFSVIYQFNAKSTKSIIHGFNNIDKDIIRLRSSELNFLLNFNNISDLYNSGDNPFEKEFSFIRNKISTTVDSLANYRIIRNDLGISEQIKILQENLTY